MRRSVVTRHCLSKKLDAETGGCRVVGVLLVSKTVLHCEMGLYVDSFLPEAEKTPILTPVLFRFALHRGRVRVLQEAWRDEPHRQGTRTQTRHAGLDRYCVRNTNFVLV